MEQLIIMFLVLTLGPTVLAIIGRAWREWRHPYDPAARDAYFRAMKGMDRRPTRRDYDLRRD